MLRLLHDPPLGSYSEYLEALGGSAIERAVSVGSAQVIGDVKASGLRGRGGAGFPTGIKWEGVATAKGPKTVVCNAAEGEPGTRKDRAIIESNPYAVVEGLVIAATVVGADRVHRRQGEVWVGGGSPRRRSGRCLGSEFGRRSHR